MHRIFSALTVLFCCFVGWIIYLANTGQASPFFKLVRTIPYGDKVGHMLIFGLLTLGFNVMSKFKVFTLIRLKMFVGTTLVASFALLEELSQHFVASRILDMGDLLADVIGISLATLLCWLWLRFRPLSHKK
ncbi:MAG: VanZ family protein [Phenylobacterium sp.]|jgi:VanZ family protein